MPFLPQASNWSFNQHLQDEFDRETPLAWSVAFDMIAETMIRVMVKQTIDPKLPETQPSGDRHRFRVTVPLLIYRAVNGADTACGR
jgi:hypothetical protein